MLRHRQGAPNAVWMPTFVIAYLEGVIVVLANKTYLWLMYLLGFCI